MENIEEIKTEEIKKLSKEEKNRMYVRANYYKNKEKKLKSIKEYREKNPDKYRDYHREYYHRKLKKPKESLFLDLNTEIKE